MTLFIDLRATASGGVPAAEATLWNDGDVAVPAGEFGALVGGRHVLLATHGFNVNREDGINALSRWEALCQVPPSSLFVGVLWPGDSAFLPVLDYPFEGVEAIKSGQLLARFLNDHAGSAASLSLVSHSLGARMVLETVKNLDRDVRHLILMAGAIENDCLVREYREAAEKAHKLWTLASRKDWVLEFAFPVGNFASEIIMQGHPYFSAALGRNGPAAPIPPGQLGGAWQIPVGWDYGHLDYLPKAAGAATLPPPVGQPADSAPPPAAQAGWKPAWSAGAVSTDLD